MLVEASVEYYASRSLGNFCCLLTRQAVCTHYVNKRVGFARALTGNYEGAIPDFKVLIAQTNNKENKAQRQGWVKALREGKNPFTKEVLENLRN